MTWNPYLVARRAFCFKRMVNLSNQTKQHPQHACHVPYMTSQYETNLWSTHVNIVWLGEPISRCVCWRTEVFKIKGFVCKHFLPSPLPPPSFIFWLLFHFSCSQNRSFVLKPNRNACYAGYIELGIYVLLVFTKLGNSIFCVFWLAPVTQNILGYSLFCDRSQDGVSFQDFFRRRELSDK